MRYMLLICVLLCTGCSVDRTIPALTDKEEDQLLVFQGLPQSNQLTLTNADEPGETLLLCLTFVRKEDQLPLSNRSIRLYHATQEGKYEPTNPADESTARLGGATRTDAGGRIYLQTILPGDYGSGSDNRHIHTSVEGAHPTAYDIQFAQYANPGLHRFVRSSDQHFMVYLRRQSDGSLVGFVQMEIRGTDGTGGNKDT